MEKDCIALREYTQKGVLQKEYQITEAGIQQFREWIKVPEYFL